MDQSILIWGIVVILGVPGLALILIESKGFFERRRSLFAPVVNKLWRYVFPSVAILLVMTQLLKLSTTKIPVKVVETGFWIAAIFTLLSLVNAILTPKEPLPGTFQFQVSNIFFQAARLAVIVLLSAQVLGNTWQIDVGGIFQTLGVGSVVIALALQSTISNLVSGLLLLFAKPFKEGDWIEVNGSKGQVIDINWRAVTITNYFGYREILPNGTIANAKITRHDPMAWDYIEMGFSYDDPPHLVIPALEKIIQETDSISDPYVGVKSYDDSSITYEVWFMGAIGFKIWLGKMELLKRIYYMAQREGFTIPYPINMNYKIDIPEGLPAKIPQKPEDDNPAISTYLRSLPYFAFFEPAILETLAQKVAIKHYAKGELIIKVGEPDEGLYIVQEGLVKLFVLDIRGEEKEIAQISAGSFFGETALLPGELSPLSAVAMQEVQVLVIDHNSAQNLIDRSPSFAREMNKFIEDRKRSVFFAQGIDQISQRQTIDNGDFKMPSLLGKVIKKDI
ncbi:small-conductance mechanosensitive channel [Xenococcus sp. PCC 7305]|uniref:cyclic nucleotide-binding domain-containing protein n=1 Tax=Xenococcus sp. PCC 7305 TaxID=102125 RepID=UPI0002ACF5A0|nr:mechanosensitive ion channel family protein [Xenococcus sp. PCC 7305]ELS00897.1 small-conductance mechanosensitive channel [Xenococcus sp. PCC 7305]